MSIGGIISGIGGIFSQGHGAKRSGKASLDLAGRNLTFQQKAARMGIRWKVEDAIKAGLHPLAALGASTFSPSPVSASLPTPSSRGFGDMGQGIDQLIKSKEGKELRMLNIAQERARLDNMNLRNVGLRKEIDELDKPGIQIGNSPLEERFNIVGQGGNIASSKDEIIKGQDGTVLVPSQIHPQQSLGVESGIAALENYDIDEDGYLWKKVGQRSQEAMESSPYHKWKYTGKKIAGHYGRGVMANAAFLFGLGKGHRKRMRAKRPRAPKGYDFRYSPSFGGWKLVKRKKGEKRRFYTKPYPGVRY